MTRLRMGCLVRLRHRLVTGRGSPTPWLAIPGSHLIGLCDRLGHLNPESPKMTTYSLLDALCAAVAAGDSKAAWMLHFMRQSFH